MIDLRSDTVTKPSQEMLEMMIKAELGDDVYGEDKTINNLQSIVAEMFGKEAALFVPSGSMANQIALKINTQPGDEIIVDKDAHILFYELGAHAIISNIITKQIPSEYGMPDIDEVESAIREDIYYLPKSKLIALENTHNRHGGTILDIDYIEKIKSLADRYKLKLHLDGARLWNAVVESGITCKEYGRFFDTISVCLSKGLGAPVGSLIVSTKEKIKQAIKVRKILGGGMRQVGILGSAGIFALQNNLQKLEYDHKKAKIFANEISDLVFINMKRVQTNIVIFELPKFIDSKLFIKECKKNMLLLSDFGNNKIRAVFHFQISEKETIKAASKIREILLKSSE